MITTMAISSTWLTVAIGSNNNDNNNNNTHLIITITGYYDNNGMSSAKVRHRPNRYSSRRAPSLPLASSFRTCLKLCSSGRCV